MANKIEYIEKTTLISIVLIKSSCELFVNEPTSGSGRIVISLETDTDDGLNIAVNRSNFSIKIKLDATMYSPDNDEKVFNAFCILNAKYNTIGDIQIEKNGIENSISCYIKQLYPTARNIIVENMAKMGINGIDAPWDMSIQISEMEHTRKKLASIKKKAVKKKAVKKKLKRIK